MKFNSSIIIRAVALVILAAVLAGLSSRIKADTGSCGGGTITLPFTDVSGTNIFFCSIATAYFVGLTNGTTPTTFSPSDLVPRAQMAAFVTRTLDQSIKRSNPRAALGEWFTNQTASTRLSVDVGGHNPRFLACDGQTVWVSLTESNLVSRFDIRTHARICTITNIISPEQLVVAGDKIFVLSARVPGRIYQLTRDTTTDGAFPSIPLLSVGDNPIGMTFDGANLWTANDGSGGNGSISRASLSPLGVTTFTIGFIQPRGILFDGVNLWVADAGDASLKRVDRSTGAVLQTITLSGSVQHPVFDGTNLWIPCAGPDQVVVVRAVGGLMGTVLATLTDNGLDGPFQAAFDGERICVTNANSTSVSLWKATDLSPIASVVLNEFDDVHTRGICSDGTTFFIGLRAQTGAPIGRVLRF